MMDSLFLIAGLLGIGDLLLARIWWRERARRRVAERHADEAIRKNYKLLDAIERKAVRAARGPVVVPISARPVPIQEAISELKTRQVAETGGTA
jgi:hypothetical protein